MEPKKITPTTYGPSLFSRMHFAQMYSEWQRVQKHIITGSWFWILSKCCFLYCHVPFFNKNINCVRIWWRRLINNKLNYLQNSSHIQYLIMCWQDWMYKKCIICLYIGGVHSYNVAVHLYDVCLVLVVTFLLIFPYFNTFQCQVWPYFFTHKCRIDNDRNINDSTLLDWCFQFVKYRGLWGEQSSVTLIWYGLLKVFLRVLDKVVFFIMFIEWRKAKKKFWEHVFARFVTRKCNHKWKHRFAF